MTKGTRPEAGTAITAAILLLSALTMSSAGTNRFDKRQERGREILTELSASLRKSTNAAAQSQIESAIAEVQAAMSNNLRAPVPARVDIFALPFVHYRYASARVGLGNTMATNLARSTSETNLDRVDPLPSTFWKPPPPIDKADLRAGFGRNALPRYDDVVWSYAGPKTGYGGHAGFEARSGDRRIKVKFGEAHSEPFSARVFHALGYNAEITDYAPRLKVRYDRRLFTEFNSRRPVNTAVTAFGALPVWTIRFQPVHDPFAFIREAVLTNGTTVPGIALRKLLRPQSAFDARFESEIAYLVTDGANVQPKDAREHSIGPWDFNQLGHENLRELRGAGLLSAWLGWFDSRFENTRLKVVERGGQVELKHYFSDLGGGLGKSKGLLSRHGEDAEAFPLFFTEPERWQGAHRMTIPFRVVNFRPIEPTLPFTHMTMDDARWMARLIGQLRAEQLRDGLLAAGFSEGETELFLDKLLQRRQRMLRDVGLTMDRD